MRVYIVTKNDYRYINGRFFPVDTFDADIKYALSHMNIFVGVYDSFQAAEAVVDKDIRVHFNINEVIDNYNSSIRIEKHYYCDSHWKEIDVIVPDSDGFNQTQMIYNITIKDFENPVDDDKKGIQLKNLKSEDIDSIAEEIVEKLSEKGKRMLVKILEDRTPEDRCSVCGSDKSVKYYFIDKEGNRKLLCNKCALTYNSIVESSKESYIVTMTDYRSANAAYIPVGSEDMRKSLIKDIYVGSYPDIETATIYVYKKIETILGQINTNLPYKINIEVCVYPDKSQKMFYVSCKDQIQLIFKIEKENMFIHRNMINSVYGATGAEQSISAENCYITRGESDESIRIDYFYRDTNNKCVSSELFKTDAYTLLYTINEYADIFTHFYDLRDRKKTKDTLTIVLTGRFPERDNYDPFNTSYIEAYVGEGDISNFMLNYIKIYNGKYEPGDEKFIKRIMDEMQSISIPIDNVYIIDKRLLPEEKEDKSSKEKKAISCEIKPPFGLKVVKEYNGVVVSYDFGDNEAKTEYYKSLNELIANLKKYTDIFTKFTDKRYGDLESDDKDFAHLKIDYNSIYDKYSITVYVNSIAKFMRILSKDNPGINDAFKEALDFCKGYRFFIVSNIGVEKPNSFSTDVDDSYIATCAQIDSDYNSLLGL